MTVAEFLLKLAQDPECFARFKKDPPAVLEEHGLSPSQAGLLLAGDLRKLRVTLEFELDVEGEYIAMRLRLPCALVFDSLSDRLQGALGDLRKKGRLDEESISRAMREIRLALLEADVNLTIVRDFVARVRERALGEEVLKSLTPGQQVVKAVHDELTELMGSGASDLAFGKFTVILLAGLQGSGKTTTAAKLALYLRKEGHKPGLIAADLQRPAAIDQLEQLGAAARHPRVPHRHEGRRRGDAQRARARACRRARRGDRRHRRTPPDRRGADGRAGAGP